MEYACGTSRYESAANAIQLEASRASANVAQQTSRASAGERAKWEGHVRLPLQAHYLWGKPPIVRWHSVRGPACAHVWPEGVSVACARQAGGSMWEDEGVQPRAWMGRVAVERRPVDM